MGTVVPRGDAWRAVVRKKGHKAITKTFSKKTLAERWVRDTELAIERKEVVTEKTCIGDLMDRYIREVVPARKLTKLTVNHYRQLARWTAKLRLEDLTADALLAWKLEKCPKASPASFGRYISTIWGVLRDAEAFWGINVPAGQMRKARTVLRRVGALGSSRSRDKRPEGDEIDQVKQAAGTTLPLGDMIDFAKVSGLRAGEITRIRWSDLDEQKRLVIVRDRKHPTKKEGNHCVVPLVGNSIEILLRQPRRPGEDRIFPYKVETLTAAYKRAKDAAGVELRFHDLRHEAISAMFERGMSIPEVALVSGHLSWENLRRYTNLKPENIHAAYERGAGKKGDASTDS